MNDDGFGYDDAEMGDHFNEGQEDDVDKWF